MTPIARVIQFGDPAVAVILEPVKKAHPPVPSDDDLLAIIRAAQENAKDLVSDAQLLADNSRYPRAYALATLAVEEMSKAELCLCAMVSPQMSPEKFWTTFRSHEGKLVTFHHIAEYLRPEAIGAVPDHYKRMVGGSRSTQNQKERALYVEYRRGKVLAPGEIGQRAARAQIRAARKWIADAEKFEPHVRNAAWALVSGAINELLDSQPDAFRAAFQAALRDGDWGPLAAMVTQMPE
jgi:AbiV family abortive infection protein